MGEMVAYVGCWEDIGFEKVSQASLRLMAGKEMVELPIYSNLDDMDVDAYFQYNKK